MRTFKVPVQDTAWDEIAHNELGDQFLMSELLKANPRMGATYLLLPAGTEVILPQTEAKTEEELPPWKR
jgi:phage tail protein X